MSATLAKPRAPTRGRDTEARARLAQAITGLREAQAELERAQQRVAEAAEAHGVSGEAWAEANETVSLARVRQPPMPQHLADAEAAFATADAAWEETAAELRRAEEKARAAAEPLDGYRWRVRGAAEAVIAAEAGAAAAALAAEIIPLQHRLVEPLAALDWLERNGVPVLGDGRLALALRGHIGAIAPARPRGAPAWEAALDALQLDADTALPA